MSEEVQQTFKKGDNVTYCPTYGDKEKGVVKEIRGDIAFVVYKCDGEWHRYEEYTGAATNLSDLKPGWADEKPKECDHHYIPTNAKWQSINQRQCVHCGHIID